MREEQLRQKRNKEDIIRKRRAALQRKRESAQHQVQQDKTQPPAQSQPRAHAAPCVGPTASDDQVSTKQSRLVKARRSELVMKSDEPEDQGAESTAHSSISQSPVPRLQLGRMGIASDASRDAKQTFPMPKDDPPGRANRSPPKSHNRGGVGSAGESVAPRGPSSEAAPATREQAEKSLRSAMSRRLGDDMMSALATKDLRARLVAAMSVGADAQLIGRAKSCCSLCSVKQQGHQQNIRQSNSAIESERLLVRDSKKNGRQERDHARLVAEEVEDWETKHAHLMEKAEKQRKLIEEARREEKRGRSSRRREECGCVHQ